MTSLGDLLDFGNFLKPFATINLPKSSIKIYHFSSEIIFGQLYSQFAIFSGHSDLSNDAP